MSRLSKTPLLTEGELHARVAELARAISRDYAGRELVLVAVLKGGLFFAADLMRLLTVPVSLEFIRARSYKGVRSKGTVEFSYLPEQSLEGKDVLVVEDILDTGRTSAAILDRLETERPASLALCALLDKRAGREVDVPVRYAGTAIPDQFVVGYGLDYGEAYRQLPAIYVLEET